MKENFYNKVYTVLVNLGGAREDDRYDFVYHHTTQDTDEWRFIGVLGFGGKYRRKTNTVDCYKEDEDMERLETIKIINSELESL